MSDFVNSALYNSGVLLCRLTKAVLKPAPENAFTPCSPEATFCACSVILKKAPCLSLLKPSSPKVSFNLRTVLVTPFLPAALGVNNKLNASLGSKGLWFR